ncbi:MAG: hypothetical protein JRI61_05765 [Deltaproteobacteria bacterium]|nr:hypothetical protein [Deltaproteobacteria bacterium]
MGFLIDSIKYGRKEIAWQKKYKAAAPKIGELAPDFELFDTEGRNRVTLSEFRDKKPVGLIFGSFT